MSPVIVRLSGEQNFKNLYRQGRRLKSPAVLLVYLPTKTDKTKVAVVVSRKISTKATTRNLYKRRLWGCLRENRQLLPTRGYNIVIAALPAIKNLTYQELNQAVANILGKIK